MSTLMEELTAIKAVEDKLTANKVANFAYTEHAYDNPLTEADGVETYDVDAEQNIPVANASVMKVNPTILTKGWRAQASSITRMLMNHFLGRCSYNLNKLNDLFSLLLTKIMAFMGQPNGIALLDSNGRLYQAVGSDKVFFTRGFLGAVSGRYLGRIWTQGTGANTDYTMYNPTYANGLWVCGSSSHGVWWSEDGKSWTQGTGANTSYSMNHPIYANGLWVCCSTQHGIWWSEDGKSWTQGTGANTTYTVQYLVYANGLWVCEGAGHGMWWSEDGKSWTQGTGANTTYAINTVAYANGLWLCVSYNHGVWYSSIDELIADGTINLGANVPIVNS